jgi:hypothetical protein
VPRPLLPLLAGAALLLAQTAAAQWLDYKTPGVPRTPDGKPNLTAPAPKTPDGKPDLTGLWRLESKANPGGALDAAGPQAWVADAAKKYMHELGRDDTGVLCLPSGPRNATDVGFAKFVQTPTLLTVLYESLAYRQVFMDGRPLSPDPNPTWMGYSVARWEGDTLVVTSNGFNDRTFLDGEGHRHSEALRMTERITRRDVGHLDIEVTFEDAKAYAKPVRIPVEATLQPDTDLIEYVCNENERSRPHLVGTAEDDRKLQVKVAADVLARYAGVYRITPPGPSERPINVTVSAKDGGLILELENGPTMTALPTSPTRFLAQGVGVEFFPGADGVVKEMVVTIVEGDLKGVRIK